MKRFFQTSFILKSEHFLWSQLQHRITFGIMYWNLNAHKTLEMNTLEKGTILSNKL